MLQGYNTIGLDLGFWREQDALKVKCLPDLCSQFTFVRSEPGDTRVFFVNLSPVALPGYNLAGGGNANAFVPGVQMSNLFHCSAKKPT